MPIDDRTTNRSYKLPNAGNFLADDVTRLRDALSAIDADIFARYTKTEVDTLIANLINGSPGALDTLNELAAALGNDPNFAATITNSLASINTALGNRYTKAESDARYVQGSVQTEMVFIATLNQSVFTLTTAIINKPSALVTVDGVVQPTSEYSLSMDGTQLTLSEGVPAGTIVRVLALGVASAGAPADDTVTTPKLRDGAVTSEKIADGTIATGDLANSAVTTTKIANAAVTSEKIADGSVGSAKLEASIGASLVPAGTMQFYAGSTAPNGWLKANGAAISRTTYANLFAAIGTTYGAGNGSTTFTLPDMRGEFPRGWDDGRGIDSSRAIGTAQTDAFQGHYHTLTNNTSVWRNVGGAVLGGAGNSAGATLSVTSPTDDGTNGTPRTAAETRPRNIALLAIIKF